MENLDANVYASRYSLYVAMIQIQMRRSLTGLHDFSMQDAGTETCLAQNKGVLPRSLNGDDTRAWQESQDMRTSNLEYNRAEPHSASPHYRLCFVKSTVLIIEQLFGICFCYGLPVLISSGVLVGCG